MNVLTTDVDDLQPHDVLGRNGILVDWISDPCLPLRLVLPFADVDHR